VKQPSGTQINSIKFHPDGTIFATAQSKGLKLWDISSQTMLMSLNNEEETNSISFSENGFYLASCGKMDDKIRIWDIRKQKVVQTKYLQSSNDDNTYINNVSFDHSGSYVACYGNVAGINRLNANDNIEKMNNIGDIEITSFNLSQNCDYFMCTRSDGDLVYYK
jgi:WD40 repeat protein